MSTVSVSEKYFTFILFHNRNRELQPSNESQPSVPISSHAPDAITRPRGKATLAMSFNRLYQQRLMNFLSAI